MPANWNIILSTVRSECVRLDGLAWPVELRAHPTARSLRLRIDEARGVLTLTCPRRIGRRAALDWARRQGDWVDGQIGGLAPPIPFAPGAVIPIEGEAVTLRWEATWPRAPQRVGPELRCGGPVESMAGRIDRYLRGLARDRLVEATRTIAARAGVSVKSVSVGDASSRWGSCSASGAIRYSWRLILAPSHLLTWVVAHEVAHRVHLNHGAGFKALERELYDGDVGAARAELRALGPRLKRIGRGH